MSKESSGKRKQKPKVHKELEGFEISINQFGELSSNLPIEKLNEFLDKNVEDKKLAERDDYDELKKGKKKSKNKK
jgi:hypothetical protein